MTTNNNNAQDLLDSRLSVYGPRVKNMEDVAQVWSGILGTEVRADQVTLMMIGYKLVRASGTPDYEDNIKDVEGYAIMFREIIGDDMISAFTTDEYLAEKSERESLPTPSELSKREAAYNRMEEAADREEAGEEPMVPTLPNGSPFDASGPGLAENLAKENAALGLDADEDDDEVGDNEPEHPFWADLERQRAADEIAELLGRRGVSLSHRGIAQEIVSLLAGQYGRRWDVSIDLLWNMVQFVLKGNSYELARPTPNYRRLAQLADFIVNITDKFRKEV